MTSFSCKLSLKRRRAATAAASRTVPTPHAAAIKSMRSLLGRPSSDASDQLRSSSSSASSSFSLNERLGVRDDRLLLRDENEGRENDSFGDFHSASGDGFIIKELPPSVDTQAESREPKEKEQEKDMSSPPLALEDLAAAARTNTFSTHAEDFGKFDTLALTPIATVSHSEEMGSEGGRGGRRRRTPMFRASRQRGRQRRHFWQFKGWLTELGPAQPPREISITVGTRKKTAGLKHLTEW
ncbi:hypothetical protein CDL15_Pgr018703 [Punica granatum]|uniref:Uncharacterized protein n=1 Tax=Punica granatum TaxID=22663 RepID=A0A218VW62_PUNGR|nr:hypothetical protein CDL15_Pgr018703 [Punica granatum]